MSDLHRGKKRKGRGNYSSPSKIARGVNSSYSGDSISNRRKIKFNKRQQQQRLMKQGLIFISFIILIVIIYFVFRKDDIKVSLGDHYIGVLEDNSIIADDIVASVNAQLTSEIGTNVKINEEIIFEDVRGDKEEIVTVDYVLSEIKSIATYKVEATAIVVDGGTILHLAKKEEATALLDDIISEYIPEGANIVESGFIENVQTSLEFVDSKEIATVEEAEDKLTIGTDATKTYSVVSGDTLSSIASKNGITVEEILTANPSLTVNTTLNVGDKLNLTVLVPFISVKTVESITFTEKETKEIEYRNDNNQPVGYQKVIQQGKDGQKEVVTQIIRVNGFETEQRVVSETITIDPVTEIIVVGTQ